MGHESQSQTTCKSQYSIANCTQRTVALDVLLYSRTYYCIFAHTRHTAILLHHTHRTRVQPSAWCPPGSTGRRGSGAACAGPVPCPWRSLQDSYGYLETDEKKRQENKRKNQAPTLALGKEGQHMLYACTRSLDWVHAHGAVPQRRMQKHCYGARAAYPRRTCGRDAAGGWCGTAAGAVGWRHSAASAGTLQWQGRKGREREGEVNGRGCMAGERLGKRRPEQ